MTGWLLIGFVVVGLGAVVENELKLDVTVVGAAHYTTKEDCHAAAIIIAPKLAERDASVACFEITK